MGRLVLNTLLKKHGLCCVMDDWCRTHRDTGEVGKDQYFGVAAKSFAKPFVYHSKPASAPTQKLFPAPGYDLSLFWSYFRRAK